MHVRYFAWFDSKAERTEFIRMLNDSTSDMDATNKLMNKYPELSLREVGGVIENFRKEISKNIDYETESSGNFLNHW